MGPTCSRTPGAEDEEEEVDDGDDDAGDEEDEDEEDDEGEEDGSRPEPTRPFQPLTVCAGDAMCPPDGDEFERLSGGRRAGGRQDTVSSGLRPYH